MLREGLAPFGQNGGCPGPESHSHHPNPITDNATHLHTRKVPLFRGRGKRSWRPLRSRERFGVEKRATVPTKSGDYFASMTARLCAGVRCEQAPGWGSIYEPCSLPRPPKTHPPTKLPREDGAVINPNESPIFVWRGPPTNEIFQGDSKIPFRLVARASNERG